METGSITEIHSKKDVENLVKSRCTYTKKNKSYLIANSDLRSDFYFGIIKVNLTEEQKGWIEQILDLIKSKSKLVMYGYSTVDEKDFDECIKEFNKKG